MPGLHRYNIQFFLIFFTPTAKALDALSAINTVMIKTDVKVSDDDIIVLSYYRIIVLSYMSYCRMITNIIINLIIVDVIK